SCGLSDAVLLVRDPVARIGTHLRRQDRPQFAFLGVRISLREDDHPHELFVAFLPFVCQLSCGRPGFVQKGNPMETELDVSAGLSSSPLLGEVTGAWV